MIQLPHFQPQPGPARKPINVGHALFLLLSGVRAILLWIISACLLATAAIVAWRFLYFAAKASGRAKDYIDHNL